MGLGGDPFRLKAGIFFVPHPRGGWGGGWVGRDLLPFPPHFDENFPIIRREAPYFFFDHENL